MAMTDTVVVVVVLIVILLWIDMDSTKTTTPLLLLLLSIILGKLGIVSGAVLLWALDTAVVTRNGGNSGSGTWHMYV